MAQESVLSTREYRGYTIQHVVEYRNNSARPGSRRSRSEYWWVKEREQDARTLRDAKALVDAL